MLKKKTICVIISMYIHKRKAYLMNNKKFLECGKIINTHGIKGTVKAESWCDSPYILAELERVYTEENGRPKEIGRASCRERV